MSKGFSALAILEAMQKAAEKRVANGSPEYRQKINVRICPECNEPCETYEGAQFGKAYSISKCCYENLDI